MAFLLERALAPVRGHEGGGEGVSSPAQLARPAGLSAPPVLNTPIASRQASPSYPLLVLQIERVANHVVLK